MNHDQRRGAVPFQTAASNRSTTQPSSPEQGTSGACRHAPASQGSSSEPGAVIVHQNHWPTCLAPCVPLTTICCRRRRCESAQGVHLDARVEPHRPIVNDPHSLQRSRFGWSQRGWIVEARPSHSHTCPGQVGPPEGGPDSRMHRRVSEPSRAAFGRATASPAATLDCSVLVSSAIVFN